MKINTFCRNILVGIPISVTLFDSVGYVARVDGSSMQPTLNPNNSITDYIFLNRWAVRTYEVERGEIVSLISPKNPDQKIIKRVIGLQGNMRSVCFVKRLEFDFACGSGVLRDALTVGDVDNDGKNELVVGNSSGDLVIFKEKDQWQKITGLGMISCVAVGDILNSKSNALVVVGGDGWCRIFCYSPSATKTDQNSVDQMVETQLECVHIQRIPANSKVLLLGDVDGDGLIEMVIALTDRVIRSYRWYKSTHLDDSDQTGSSEKQNKSGKLICLNKWESSNQIGAISLQKGLDDVPAILVAQPGGTFMRIRYSNGNVTNDESIDNNSSVHSENLSAPGVDYQFLGISRMRNQSVSTEVLADLNVKDSSNYLHTTKPYTVATLDGTIMLVRDEVILWAIQVDHQIFALEKLDITGDGSEDIVACSWDGQTYMLDQNKNSVRFQLDEPVQAFCCGHYSVDGQQSIGVACLVYVTFKNKIYIYYDLQISDMVARRLNFSPNCNQFDYLQTMSEREKWNEKRRLVEKILYENSH